MLPHQHHGQQCLVSLWVQGPIVMRKCGIIRAPALYNLYLRVTSRSPNGSHLLRGFGVALREWNKNWLDGIGEIHTCMMSSSIYIQGWISHEILFENGLISESHKRDICEQTINDEIALRVGYVTHFYRNFFTCHSMIYLFPTGETDFPHTDFVVVVGM